MIEEALKFFQDNLSPHLVENCRIANGKDPRVGYLDLLTDPPTFSSGIVSLLLINIEEEKQFRPPNPFEQVDNSGLIYSVSPPLSLNLLVMFAVKFDKYLEAAKHLSSVIQFFQSNPVFTAQNYPDSFPDSIERLTVELYSMNIAQQNELWSMLKTSYLPSVVYKVRMLTYQEGPVKPDIEIHDIENRLHPK